MSQPPTNKIKYDTSNVYLEYKTNREYRALVRSVFDMNIAETIKQLEPYKDCYDDDETYDEAVYDEVAAHEALDQIYDATKDHKLFQELYELAAAKILSVDPTIGQAILFSYGYFYLFHACLCVFLSTPENFNENCLFYKQLKHELNKR